MANTDIDLKAAQLSLQELGRGYNIRQTITYKDLINNAPSDEVADNTQTYYISNIYKGCALKFLYFVREEAFLVGGSNSVNMEIGISSDPDYFLTSTGIGVTFPASTQLNGTGFQSTDTTSSNGETNDVTVTVNDTRNSIFWSTDDQIEVKITPPSSKKLSEATAGKITFYADILFP